MKQKTKKAIKIVGVSALAINGIGVPILVWMLVKEHAKLKRVTAELNSVITSNDNVTCNF